ncbi:hypothetical protein EV14_2913 [Prochlorococcus sp. MIT 0703]|nr:hypothetical protein EV12_2572 [Prochlorococcus sp. MIT 0701]KGG30972.1 hypothetical protein EV14_2913 [Prochlorococcus sp. MIT 0703]
MSALSYSSFSEGEFAVKYVELAYQGSREEKLSLQILPKIDNVFT